MRMTVLHKLFGRRQRSTSWFLCMFPFLAYIVLMTVHHHVTDSPSLDVSHNASICIEKQGRYDVTLLNDFFQNGSSAIPENATIDDLINRFKPQDGKIRGDIVKKTITDSRYYLIEPYIDFDQIAPTTLFVFVQSACQNYKKRERIRQTWANRGTYKDYKGNPIYVIFTMGLPPNVFISNASNETLNAAIMEASTYRDILLINMIELYDSLTVKGFLSMFWVASLGPRVSYTMKTDDDVMLNTFAWFHTVNKLRYHNVQCAIAGFVWQNSPVTRSGKYYVEKSQYSYDVFPAFASGSGYLMTRDAMLAVLETSINLPLLIRDDPYFAGIIPRLLGIPMLSFPRSAYVLYTETGTIENLNKRGVMVLHDTDWKVWNHAWTLFNKRNLNGYAKGFESLLYMAMKNGLKYSIPIVLRVASDTKTPLPENWYFRHDACLSLKCNTGLTHVQWRLPA